LYDKIQNSIKKVTDEIVTLKTKNDSIARDLLEAFEAKANKLEAERVNLENKFCTIHDAENRINQDRFVLKKKSIGFNDLFDHIEVINRDHWIIHIDNSSYNYGSESAIISGEYDYYIRKFKRKVKFEVKI